MALGESRHELDLVEWAAWIAQPAVIPGLQLEMAVVGSCAPWKLADPAIMVSSLCL